MADKQNQLHDKIFKKWSDFFFTDRLKVNLLPNFLLPIFALTFLPMPEIILLLISSIVLMPPLISGFFARSRGRSFWFWFFTGWILPFISVFILFFLPPPANGATGRMLTNETHENHS